MDGKADIEQHLEVLTAKGLVVAFVLKDNAAGDPWSNLFVAYNANSEPVTLNLPGASVWRQVVNERQAGTAVLATASGTVTLPGLSMAVLYR
jgi:pullulanase/glycogen debranching enzyme